MDLTKPLVSRIIFEGRLQIVEYEGLSNICYHCGKYGHAKEDRHEWKELQKQKVVSGEQVDTANGNVDKEPYVKDYLKFGPWMIATRRGNKSKWGNANGRIGHSSGAKENNGSKNITKEDTRNSGHRGGSRFKVLMDQSEEPIEGKEERERDVLEGG